MPSDRRPSAADPSAANPSPTGRKDGPRFDRRRFLAWASAAGFGGGPLLRALAEEAQAGGVTAEAMARCEELTGLRFTPEERELALGGVGELRGAYEAVRGVALPNDVPPALRFDARLPGESFAAATAPADATANSGAPAAVADPRASAGRRYDTPEEAEALAFLPAAELGRLLRARRVRSVDLTRMYLARLRRYDPLLHCVVTLTEERALEQAERADRELDAGRWRGPLHGVPWGAKDLLAVGGYPTTWGAAPYRDQVVDQDATVVERLDAAGAVLVAKLTLGALAWGDVWFGGMTRNPWKLEQGSSGSSAGSAAATAAGLVGFAIGTETWGSIVSPSTRVGASGLRPTFGRVSRHGAMALSWSMDKIGPICRSIEDCGVVLAAIHGPDGEDPTVIDVPFEWPPRREARRLRVGFTRSLFEEEREEQAAWRGFDLAALDVLRDQGIELVPVELPADLPVASLSYILSAEAAAAFDELTRSNRDDQLVRQVEQAWPNVFRQARYIPAVEYLQANRVRTLLMRDWARFMADLDAYVVPSFGGANLLATNLTGHPQAVVPDGFRPDGTPTSLSFIGRRFGESDLLALAMAYQQATDWHQRHPDLEAALAVGE
ncbi:MAG TPA: amidase [Thermoanaerobaculia bacterium]|nr:amidase [Thermoanaerobaculia bacterium]